MGPEGASKIIHRSELAGAPEPEKLRKFTEEYKQKFANPYVAAGRGYIDDVIEPQETRPRLIHALRASLDKREIHPSKKHGNVPL